MIEKNNLTLNEQNILVIHKIITNLAANLSFQDGALTFSIGLFDCFFVGTVKISKQSNNAI